MTVARFWTNTSPELIIRAAQKVKKPKKGKGGGGGGGGWNGRGGGGGIGGGGPSEPPLLDITAYLYYQINVTANNGGTQLSCDELELLDQFGVNHATGAARGGVATASSVNSFTGDADGLYLAEGSEDVSSGGGNGWRPSSGSTGWSEWFDDVAIEVTSAVMLADQTTAPKNFTFEYSDNGSDWTVALAVTDESGWASSASFENRIFSWSSVGAHRYWKIDITANNGHALLVIRAIRYITASGEIITATGKSKALCRADTQWSKSHFARKMFAQDDSSPGNLTGWMTKVSDTTALLQIHTGVPTKLKEIKWWVSRQDGVNYQNVYMPKDFTVKASNDNTNWTTLLTVTGQDDWADDPKIFTLAS